MPMLPPRPQEGSEAGGGGRGRGATSEKRQQLSRAALSRGQWGFHPGGRRTPAPILPGEYACSEISPCGRAPSAGARVSCRWESPGHPLPPPQVAPSSPGAWDPRVGSSGRGKAGFSQPGAGSSSRASWKVTCDLQNPSVRLWLCFSFVVSSPRLHLR